MHQYWPDALSEHQETWEWHTNLLASTINSGASLYLRDAIISHGGIPEKEGRPLLDYAVFLEPKYSPWAYGMNPEAARVILQHGAEPNTEFDGWTPWRSAIYHIVRRDIKPIPYDKEVDRTEQRIFSHLDISFAKEVFETVRILPNHGANANEIFEMKVGGMYRKFYASGVLQLAVLESECCLGATLMVCTCETAQILRPEAESLIELLNTYQNQEADQRVLSRMSLMREGRLGHSIWVKLGAKLERRSKRVDTAKDFDRGE